MRVWCDLYKVKKYEISLEDYYNKYDDKKRQKLALLKGAPALYNIEGHYIELNNLGKVIHYPHQKMIVERFIASCLHPTPELPERLVFIIRR